MPARICAPEPWHRRPVCKGTGAGPPRPPSPPGRLPQCKSWRLTPALRPRRLPGAGPLSCPGPAPLRPLSLPRPCHHPGHHRCLCADLRPLGGPHPVCLPGPSCPSGSSGRARPCPSPGLVAPCTFERGLGLPAPFLHLLEGSGAHSSPWGLLISPRKEMGQGHEGEASRCRCNGRPAQRAPRVRGVAVPQPSGASFPGGKSRLQGTSSVPAAIPGGGGPPTPLPGGPRAEQKPEAGVWSPGLGPAACPRCPAFLTGQRVQVRIRPAWLDARSPGRTTPQNAALPQSGFTSAPYQRRQVR